MSEKMPYSEWAWLRNSLSDQCREHLDDAKRLRKRSERAASVRTACLRLADLHTEAATIFAVAMSNLEKEGHADAAS